MSRYRQVICTAAACLLAIEGEGGGPLKHATLQARGVLPAHTFAPGPPSGTLLGAGPINGVSVPFATQPVQGVSALTATETPGEFWAMPDNGYGRRDNSADFNLRVYRIRPDFERASGGGGGIAVVAWVELSDPDGKVPFPIVNETTAGRVLTGADFDIESMRIDAEGGFWFGDEFGPFLLHTDASGRMLDPPYSLDGVVSPSNPLLGTGTPTLPNSRGFEGMAIGKDGRHLYPILEGALAADTERQRRLIYEFDIDGHGYTGLVRQYRTDAPGYNVPELVALDRHRYLAIERDSLQGAAAAFKKVFLVDFRRTDEAGYLEKHEVLDLLAIHDPHGISLPERPGDVGLGVAFRFSFETIEALLPLGGNRVLVMNDNNYPFSTGRNPALPDDNEAIVVHVPSYKRTR